MITLFYHPSNASMAPHMLLRHIDVPFRLELVDRANNAHKGDAYRRLNPTGRIPALVDGSLVLFETAAICLHLADTHPQAGLAPAPGTPERAELYKWLMFLTNSPQPDLMAFYYPERFTTDTSPDAIDACKQAGEHRSMEWFRILDDHLRAGGPYMLGQSLSLLDYYLFMLGRWGRGFSGTKPRDLPHLGPYLTRMADMPVVRAVCEAEALPQPWY